MLDIVQAIAWSLVLGATIAFVLLSELRSRVVCGSAQRHVATILIKLCTGSIVVLAPTLGVINLTQNNVVYAEAYAAIGVIYITWAVALLRDDSWLYRCGKRLKNRVTNRRASLHSSTTA